MPPRHRGRYDPSNPAPFELSRSRLEQFVRCPACFWLQLVKGVKFPSLPAFLLNSATDTLLKRDFDRYRIAQAPHPVVERNGLGHLIPYAHEDLELWRNSRRFASSRHFNVVDRGTNLLLGGGVDDVWQNTQTGLLHVVDYKSTASGKGRSPTLQGAYKAAYKRQIEVYQWVLAQMGYPVAPIGYFVYVDAAVHDAEGMLAADGRSGSMDFSTSILEHTGDTNWIAPTLNRAKQTLGASHCPPHATQGFGSDGRGPCEYGRLIDQCAA
jgi:hypothetical protein